MKVQFRHFRIGEVLALVALVALLVTGIYYAFSNSVGFDEAFNLQIPVNLVRNGKYGTTYQGGQLFDPVITTGPTVLLPIAVTFKVFGLGINSARLIPCLYWCLAILLVAWISFRLGDWPATLMIVAFVPFLPNCYEFGLKVLGEIPGLFFFLIGLLFISRNKSFLGGLLLGLSVLAKLSFLFSLAPLAFFFGAEWLWMSNDHRQEIVKSFFRAMVGFCIFPLIWEVICLAYLGPLGYLSNLMESLGLLGLITSTRHLLLPSSFSSRLLMIGIPFNFSHRSIIFIVVTILGGLFLWNLISYRRSFFPEAQNADGKLYWLLCASGAAYLFLWLLVGPINTWRYLLPIYILWGLVVCVALAHWLKGIILFRFSAMKSISNAALFFVLFFVIVYPGIKNFSIAQQAFKQTYACQVDLAEQIRQMSEQKALFGYWGWFQSPELSFLSQENFYDVIDPKTRTNLISLKKQGYRPYVIVSWVQESLAAATLTDETPFLGDLVIQSCGFKIYKFNDGQAG